MLDQGKTWEMPPSASLGPTVIGTLCSEIALSRAQTLAWKRIRHGSSGFYPTVSLLAHSLVGTLHLHQHQGRGYNPQSSVLPRPGLLIGLGSLLHGTQQPGDFCSCFPESRLQEEQRLMTDTWAHQELMQVFRTSDLARS